MSELRLWIHQKIARLDGARERRFVALAATLILASLAFGPYAARTVYAVFNAPRIIIENIGTDPRTNPVSFKARTTNVILPQIVFIITPAEGAPITLLGQLKSSARDAIWKSDDFFGTPGMKYSVIAQGLSSMTNQVIESRAIAFSVIDTKASMITVASSDLEQESGPKHIDISQIAAWPGAEPAIEIRGIQRGFKADSAFFRVKSMTGLAFLGEYPAESAEGGVWQALFKVPGGSLYQVTLVGRLGEKLVESASRNVNVPAATALKNESAPTADAPESIPATLLILLPNSESETTGPVSFAARVRNATATSIVFEVVDPAGVKRVLPASAGPDGQWTSVFIGEAGRYELEARAIFEGGAIARLSDSRSFKIIAAATSTKTNSVDVLTTGPSVELFSPSETSGPLNGAVSIVGRLRNGLPEKVVAVVSGPKNSETFVLATKAPTGDYWTAIFEGVDGEYSFKMRATVGEDEYYSEERRFTIQKPANP